MRLIAAGGDRAVGAKDNVSAILGKLGVENRVQAAVLAHRTGLTRTDPRPAA
ncbi:hypothetical protein ACFCXH_19810 [Streptomyces nojiriensis]|uniref:hypothetical protein n=1 Tax=Streptomyces nojiriensis TaxID=66374 RepID=UPI0035D97F04